MRTRSIRRQLFTELLLLGAFLVVAGTVGLITVYLWGLEDSATYSYVELAESVARQDIPDEYLEDWASRGNPLVWKSLDRVPQNVLKLFPVEYHKENQLLVQYEYQGQTMSGPPDFGLTMKVTKGAPDKIYFFLKHQLANGEDVYLYHSNTTLGYSERTRQQTVTLLAVLNCAAIFLLVLLLAQRISKVALNPLKDLTVMANSVDTSNADHHYSVTEQDNEIGTVARTLQQSLNRIRSFHDREKQFLRQASHELRTPIAVISSALDVVEQRQRQGVSDVARPLLDIRRSTRDMKDTVQALLDLARSESDGSSGILRTDLGELAKEIVEDHQHLLESKAVTIEQDYTKAASVNVEKVYLRVVMSNLIRNAFEHAGIGTIFITCIGSSFLIRNPLDVPISEIKEGLEPARYGFGISIVEAIVEKCGWQLRIEKNDDYLECQLLLCD